MPTSNQSVLDHRRRRATHPAETRPASSASSSPKEVTTVAQRVFRALFSRIDEVRIQAHRDAVLREIFLSRPIF